MATVWIDDRRVEVTGERNMLEVSLQEGADLPYFCWHPALGSVGACRQCAVKQLPDVGEDDEGNGGGKIVMACMTPAKDGTRISITDAEAASFRKSIVEFLMLNHPHDCPVCDEGGECHLQDVTVMAGHVSRRTRFPKRSYENQDLGPFIEHEMNRCIQCYRCVRFYGDHAGGRDLQAFGAHDHVYFGRQEDGPLESVFSGNLVEVCPTGVFTDRPFHHRYFRKWDLETAPSICPGCSLGCNVTPGAREGQVLRIRNRYHGAINGYFLCDRGRYGHGHTESEQRLPAPIIPRGASRAAEALDEEEALERLAAFVRKPGRVIGIGSPRATLEDNLALREIVGAHRFYAGVSEAQAKASRAAVQVLKGPLRSASVKDAEACDAVLVLGEDLTETAPRLALALRQAAEVAPRKKAAELDIPAWHEEALREQMQEDRGPIFLATVAPSALDDVAEETLRLAPEDIARLGFAVAAALDESLDAPDLPADQREAAERIAHALSKADRPLVVTGTSLENEGLVQAAGQILRALGAAREEVAELALVFPECNSLGLSLLDGRDVTQAIAACEDPNIDRMIVLENDLYRRATPELIDRLFERVSQVATIDLIAHDTMARSSLGLPATPFAESDGHLVNAEGRLQRRYAVTPPRAGARPSWRWLSEAAQRAGGPSPLGWRRLDDGARALATLEPFAPLSEEIDRERSDHDLPRQTHRASGRTAGRVHLTVVQPPPADPDSAFVHSMEGHRGPRPARHVSEVWSPGWNSVQSLNRFQEEIAGPLKGGDPGVRLFEPARPSTRGRAPAIPEPFAPRDDRLRLISAWHALGSEELTALSEPIAARAPAPYVALHPEDAEACGLAEGARLRLDLGDRKPEVACAIAPDLPRGLALVPRGLAGVTIGPLPTWGRVETVEDDRLQTEGAG